MIGKLKEKVILIKYKIIGKIKKILIKYTIIGKIKKISEKHQIEEKEMKCKSTIFKKADFFKKEHVFYNLGPEECVDKKGIYYNKFMTAVEKECKMIAFTGAYGVGKTSIINSILKRLKHKEIRISLGDYRHQISENKQEYDEKVQGTKSIDKYEGDTSEIELKIVQQIVYTTEEKKIPNSKLRRIVYINKKQKIIIALLTFIGMLLMNILIPSTFEKMYKQPYNITLEYILDKTKIIENNNEFVSGLLLENWVPFLVSILICIGCWCLLYKLTILLKTKINITFFKYKDLEIQMNTDKESSVFNKYLDEIVYFFKETKHNIMVIEDLDRYGNISLEVFQKLKELNYLLNQNDIISKNRRSNICVCYQR